MVQVLQLSQQQWQSPFFFADFFALEKLQLFSVEVSQLTFSAEPLVKGYQQGSKTESIDARHELILFSSEYNFHTLNTMLEQLAKKLTIAAIRKVPSPDDADEFALAIEVAVSLSDEITQLLMHLSDESGWELALVEKKRPELKKAGLLLMDMDSTTIQIECIDEIAKLAGVGEQVAEVTALAMQGKLDFSQSLRKRVATLKNADESILAEVADNLPLMPGLERLLDVLKANNWRIAIASGGFTYFADRLKEDLGLDAAISNVLSIDDGKLTGEVTGEIVDAQVKRRVLGELAQQYSIEAGQTVAMGDGANDLLMLNAAALGVACHAKPVVREQAAAAINHYGLDILVYILAR